MKVLCVAPCKSQVAPDFCSQTDYLTPPKGVSTIPSQEITVYLLALGSLLDSSVVSGRLSLNQHLEERRAHPPTCRGAVMGCGDCDGFSRVQICESRVPVSAISELIDLRQVTVTSEPQFFHL